MEQRNQKKEDFFLCLFILTVLDSLLDISHKPVGQTNSTNKAVKQERRRVGPDATRGPNVDRL